jgi:ferredoxin
MARTILQGLGLSEEKIRLAVSPFRRPGTGEKTFEPRRLNEPAVDSSQPQATFSPGPDKRTMVRLAAQHLYNQSGAVQPELPLPAGSPFGAIAVDSGACTLCLACVTVCPSKALSPGDQVPQLKFRESLCYQCGLCQETCPEGAIRLLPRLLCDLETVETPVTLREAEPLRCIECGRPFASPAMVERIHKKLQGHWMYTEERQLRRLRMCGTCRARDALMSEDMQLWNQQ